MREESHLDDMRAAIRGDFKRLAERRGGQELMRDPVPAEEGDEHVVEQPEERVETVPVETVPPEAAPGVEGVGGPEEPPTEPWTTGEAEPAEVPVDEPDEEPTPEETPPRRGFWARLLGL